MKKVSSRKMTPLIDVIFLLLTFFIYTLIMMRPFDVLPVSLTRVDTDEQAERTDAVAITVDRAGLIYVNREEMTAADLDERMLAWATADTPPTIIVAMEEIDDADEPSPGVAVDRGPVLLSLIERLYRRGLDFAFAGPPPAR